MTSANERMKKVIAALGFTSKQFEKEVGLSEGFVSRINETVKLTSMRKIRARFPRINQYYVNAGVGDMFTDEPMELSEENFKGRFQEYIKFKGISKSEFISKAKLSNRFPILPPGGIFSVATTYKLNKFFPDLNLTWLVFGVGNMLNDGKTKDIISEQPNGYKERINQFCEEIGISRAKFLTEAKCSKTSVTALPATPTERFLAKVRVAFPQLNISWLIYGNGDMFNMDAIPTENNVSFIPLVPLKAQAGYLCGYGDTEYIAKLPTIPFIKMGNDKLLAFEVSGDSMDDGSSRAYQNGDIVICKECPTELIKTNGLHTKGREFIIVHTNGILLKSISDIDLTSGNLTLHSYNPLFDDLTLDLTEVKQIWVVEYQQKRKK